MTVPDGETARRAGLRRGLAGLLSAGGLMSGSESEGGSDLKRVGGGDDDVLVTVVVRLRFWVTRVTVPLPAPALAELLGEPAASSISGVWFVVAL